MFCDHCKKETTHFATMSLGLPCCRECFSLNDKAIFGSGAGLLKPLKQDDPILVKNAVIESEVLHRQRKD